MSRGRTTSGGRFVQLSVSFSPVRRVTREPIQGVIDLSALPEPNLPTGRTSDDLAMRVATFMAASAAGGTRVGPFTIRFDNHSANVWRNYAVPDIDATPTDAD